MDFLEKAITNEKELKQISQDFGIVFLVAFGSMVSKKFNEESDFDLAILLEEKINPSEFFDLLGKLQKVFTRFNLHLTLLNDTDLLFKHKIVSKGKLFFGDAESFLQYKLLIHKIYLTDMPKITGIYDKILLKNQKILERRIYG